MNSESATSTQESSAKPVRQPTWADHLPNLMILVTMIGMSLYYASRLPEQIPTRFDLSGNPIQFTDRAVFLVYLPAIYTLIITMIPLFTRLSPRSLRLQQSKHLIPRLNRAIGLLLVSIHIGLMTHALNPEADGLSTWFTFGMGMFMLSLGSLISQSERNFFIGFRTPWSMATDANWKATHNFGGKIMVITGVGLIAGGILASLSPVITIASVIFAMLIPVFYSLWYYQQFEKGTERDRLS